MRFLPDSPGVTSSAARTALAASAEMAGLAKATREVGGGFWAEGSSSLWAVPVDRSFGGSGFGGSGGLGSPMLVLCVGGVSSAGAFVLDVLLDG